MNVLAIQLYLANRHINLIFNKFASYRYRNEFIYVKPEYYLNFDVVY